MWVLATNVLARGITDSAIACGAAAALALGAFRVEAGTMELSALLIILMLGIEIFRPMRELRTVLHQGMVGMSAAQGLYQILDGRPLVEDAPAAQLAQPLAPEHRVRERAFPLSRHAARRCMTASSFAVARRRAHRHGRRVGRRQIVDRAPAAALLRSGRRARSASAATICASCRSSRSAA